MVQRNVVVMATAAVNGIRDDHIGTVGQKPFLDFLFERDRVNFGKPAIRVVQHRHLGDAQRMFHFLHFPFAHQAHFLDRQAELMPDFGGATFGQREQKDLVAFLDLFVNGTARAKRFVVGVRKNVEDIHV